MTEANLNLHLGDYKLQDVAICGSGFDKVNLITGMKGGGKSHIAKGIITEELKAGMSAVIFDINGEYSNLDGALVFSPGKNLKFRIDYTEFETLFRIIERLSPSFSNTPTASATFSKLPGVIEKRKAEGGIPDTAYLKRVSDQVIEGRNQAEGNMRYSYERAIDTVHSSNLIMTESEAKAEDALIKAAQNSQVREPLQPPAVMSLRTAFSSMFAGQPKILVFQIGGLPNLIQKVIVSLVIDHLKKSCEKQAKNFDASKQAFPIYPTVFFEEAHMYMDARDIDELIPLIRHIGINVFFVTNTPCALPDSVFRLLDNLIMTRMLNRKDIDRVADCGLIDKETIVGFAKNLKDRHALFLSSKDGATKGFPLVLRVRDFPIPKSGQTRSQWVAMREAKKLQNQSEASDSAS